MERTCLALTVFALLCGGVPTASALDLAELQARKYGKVKEEDVFYFFVSTRGDMINPEGFLHAYRTLAPAGDGDYVRIGMRVGIAYLGRSAGMEAGGYDLIDPDTPGAMARYYGNLQKAFAMADKYNIPIRIAVFGGQWFDPAGKTMDACDYLEQWRRNCMWFADNKVQKNTAPETDPMPFKSAEVQINGASYGDVYLTKSHYAKEVIARKRKNRMVALKIFHQFYRKRPDLVIVLSLEGELEMNHHNGPVPADYNPYAIKEFMHWIRGLGCYDPVKGDFKGSAYIGCERYHDDAEGLKTFNKDFGTAFTTWDLKYYAEDEFRAVDSGKSETFDLDLDNPGGFDPPRYQAKGKDMLFPDLTEEAKTFWQLWNTFRAKMIQNEYIRSARDARSLGFPKHKLFTQCIPGTTKYISQQRIYMSAVPPFHAINDLSSVGLNVFNDGTPWIAEYVRKNKIELWGGPEWRFHDPRGPVEPRYHNIETYWFNNCSWLGPLVYPDHFEPDSGNTKAVNQFVAKYKNIPRSRRHTLEQGVHAGESDARTDIDDEKKIYGF